MNPHALRRQGLSLLRLPISPRSDNSKMVGLEGVEPTRLSTTGPKPVAAANYATDRWSERWESNPHGARRQALNLLCIPIPPRSDVSTIWVRASESNRLSPAYETGMVYVSVPLARIIYVWYWRRDLNSRHTRCKRAVLPLNYSSINRCYSIVKSIHDA